MKKTIIIIILFLSFQNNIIGQTTYYRIDNDFRIGTQYFPQGTSLSFEIRKNHVIKISIGGTSFYAESHFINLNSVRYDFNTTWAGITELIINFSTKEAIIRPKYEPSDQMIMYLTEIDKKEIERQIKEKERKEKERIRQLKIKEAQERKKYNTAIKKGDLLFSKRKFVQAKLKYLDAQGFISDDFIQEKIDQCLDAICDNNVLTGDSLFNINELELALENYEKAQDCWKSPEILQKKIENVEMKIVENKVNQIQRKADAYFNDKEYDLALDNYKIIISIDSVNIYALQKIKQIDKIKFLNMRSKTVLSYKKSNSIDFNKFNNQLFNDINLQIKKNKKGNVILDYLISFDTLGNNLSAVNRVKSSLSDFQIYLSAMANNGILNATVDQGYFMNSQEKITFDIKWNSYQLNIESNDEGISNINNQNSRFIDNFIKKQPFNYGSYTFEIKEKEINGTQFTDINLVNYKTVGPGSAFYSVLMPGMGTLKVTYGEKGWGRFTSFLISSCVAIGSHLYSKDQYNNYLNSTNQTDYDSYYRKANNSHKIALISGGISASIYLYDIIWVISKGIKNNKDSYKLRKNLKQNSIQIQSQPIK